MNVGFTTILPEEFHALIGVSDKAFRLYLYLRQFMIRSNGTAAGAGVTWPDIARNGLYVAPGQGIQNSGMPDKRKMMRLRDELMRCGLIEDRGDHRNYLAFYFPIFMQNRARYFFDQNKPAPIPHPETAPIPHPESTGNTGDAGGTEPQPVPNEGGKPAPYTEEPNLSINQSGDGRFSMFMDWEVSDFFGALAKRSMIDIEGEHQPLYAETVSEFVLFWMSPEAKEKYPHKAYRSQRDWERALLQTLQRNKYKPAPKATDAKDVGSVPDQYRIPKDNNQLVKWAEKHGYSPPHALTYYEYRQLLYREVDERQRGVAAPKVKSDSVSAEQRSRARQEADRQREQVYLKDLAMRAGIDPAKLGVK